MYFLDTKIIKSIGVVVGFVIIFVWGLTGVYTVNSGEEAVILRFGKHVKTVKQAGLKWHIPSPIETVEKVNVNIVYRMEFGFVTVRSGNKSQNAEFKEIPEEALMLTGDENLVNVETIVQYRISDAENYLFKVDLPKETLKVASEASIRRVVANNILDRVLTDNKFAIQQEIKDDLQDIADKYKLGIAITAVQLQDVGPPNQVDAAFKDVANAREDKNSFINESQSYENEVIPKARGNAAEILNKANAYKERRIAESRGDVANFVQILERYQLGKEVTRTRMYLETLEEILPNVEKYIVNENGNTIKWLPLAKDAAINSVIEKKKEGGN